jgi:hypothetical protein
MPEAFGQKEAQRMSRSIADDPLDRDWPTHVKRVAQDSALKAPRKVSYPSAVGGLKPLIDKVGGSR